MYITTPIYYVNGRPHIGSVYTTLACDTLARFYRFLGRDVFFLTGTDEHGQKIEKSAGDQTPQAFVDEISQEFRDVFDHFDISYDDFIRTTQPRHYKAVQHLWESLKDHIYLGSYKGYYAIQDEAYYAESEIVDGKAPSGASVSWVEEPSYFFKLSDFQKPLLDFYKANPDFIQPQSRRNEVIRFVEGGLTDLSISRTNFSWGIPVPDAPSHVIYVWLDALTNYMTALGYPDTHSEKFQKFWPDALHIIGKDILRFHAVYWPAFLMAAGLPLPRHIFAHGWWTSEGEKMSKSRGNVVNPLDYAQEFGRDALRYYLLREVPFGQDGDFSRQGLIQRYESELANTLGNLVQRVVSFIHKYCNGQVPEPSVLMEEDKTFLSEFERVFEEMKMHITEKCALHRYVELFMSLAIMANQYVDQQKPWSLRKENEPRFHTVLYILIEGIKKIALIGAPILPDAMGTVLKSLDVENAYTSFHTRVIPGQHVTSFDVLFPKK